MQTTQRVIYMQGNPRGRLIGLILCHNTKVTTSELFMLLFLNVLSMLTDIQYNECQLLALLQPTF